MSLENISLHSPSSFSFSFFPPPKSRDLKRPSPSSLPCLSWSLITASSSSSERPLFLLPSSPRTDGPKLGEARREGRDAGRRAKKGRRKNNFLPREGSATYFRPEKPKPSEEPPLRFFAPPHAPPPPPPPLLKIGADPPPRAKHSFTGRRRRKTAVISGGVFRRSSLRYISDRETPSWRNEMSERG